MPSPSQRQRVSPFRTEAGRSCATAGQAAVELVALLPLIGLALLALWQFALAGHTVWAAGAAARGAARAQAIGDDPALAARSRLPARLERGLRVQALSDGSVRVAVRIPAVVPQLTLGHAAASARFAGQEG